MNKKNWMRCFVFISFFLFVSCGFSLYAQEEGDDFDAIMEEEEDIFYEVEDEVLPEETESEKTEKEEIDSIAEESLQPFKEVEEEAVTIEDEEEEEEAATIEDDEEDEDEAASTIEEGKEEKDAAATEDEEVSVQKKTEEKFFLEPEGIVETDGGEEKRYTVRTWSFDRDCLWNIADHFYNNPWQWRRIWEANSYIQNPDLIYQGNELVIPGVTEKIVKQLKLPETMITEEPSVQAVISKESDLPEKEEEVLREEVSTLPSPIEGEEEIEEVEEQVAETAAAEQYEDKEDTFLAPLDWEYDGIIIRSKERKMLLSAYTDDVFIDCGRDKGVVSGMRFNIYRKSKTVKHPRTKKVLGVQMRKVGVLEVKHDIQEDNATAQIINSREPIKIGDLIKIQQ
ncbi:LysM peptidoglycan-binding domain-containing protein [bacterium]|nr:LysM peptidoglycan-binding domain-containing protein [bacterium]